MFMGQLSADCAAALVKLLRRCVNQMTGKTRQYVDTSIKFEREASQQVWPDTAHWYGPRNSLALMAECAFTGTKSHASMGFCKRCTVQCAFSPVLPGSQARLFCWAQTVSAEVEHTACHIHASLCALQQVESVQLASESAHKQLELELANAKHNAAQAAAAHKSAAASWQGELDWQKSEVLPMAYSQPCSKHLLHAWYMQASNMGRITKSANGLSVMVMGMSS